MAAINKAEGEKQAEILRAEGVAQARIIEADAEREAIQRIIGALQDKGKPDQYLIAMKYLETLSNITNGENNKVVATKDNIIKFNLPKYDFIYLTVKGE